jgi:type II secretory pathway pseudopilin PulG
MPMNPFRREEGIALLTSIVSVALMATLGFSLLAVADRQTAETRTEKSSEMAFNLAEATLNAQAFLAGRNWPKSTAQMPAPASAAAPCSGQTMTGTLDAPATTVTLHDQLQSMLAQTYRGATAGSQWWVTACEEGGRTAWDSSLLNGLAYDPSVVASPTAKPRRMWIRAEALVGGRKRSVVGLVQAGQAPVFPPNLAVVTGKMGADVTTTTGQLLTGAIVGPLLGSLIGGGQPVIEGPVGLRCSLLDNVELLGCLSGLFKATSMLTVAPLLQANDWVDFRADTVISAEQLALLRQQAQETGTYYATTSGGVGGVANGAACLPAGATGKIVFIEQVGNGTGSCILNTNANPSATALIVGSGGVRVQGTTGTFTGVIYALHRKSLAGNIADVRIEGTSAGSPKVVGAVFADDNPDLVGAAKHGVVEVVPPPINMTTVVNDLRNDLAICHVIILGPILCAVLGLVTGTLDALLDTLDIPVSTLLGELLPFLNPALPAITYNATVVRKAATFGDSALVTGSFRQITPSP